MRFALFLELLVAHPASAAAEEFAAWPGRPPEVSTKPEDTEDLTYLNVDESPTQSPADETLAGFRLALGEAPAPA